MNRFKNCRVSSEPDLQELDYYGMFESAFEYGEGWSTQDFAADLFGTGFGMAVGGSFNVPLPFIGNIPIGVGDRASRFADWLY